MKAQQIQAQFEEQSPQKIRKHSRGTRRLFAGLAAAAAVMIGGTVTVGALNGWDYSGLFNRWFLSQDSAYEDFDFTGMGTDINDEIALEGFTVTLQSVVAEANALHVIYNCRLDPGYEAQLPQNGEEIYAFCMPNIQVLDEAGNGYTADTETGNRLTQNADGSFDGVQTIGLRSCQDFSDKTLVISNGFNMTAGTMDYLNAPPDAEPETGGVQTPLPENLEEYTYSLAGITVLKGVTKEGGVTLSDSGKEAPFDSVSVSPLRLAFTVKDVPVTPVTTSEPGVTVGGGLYGFEAQFFDENGQEISYDSTPADIPEDVPEYVYSDPTPEAYEDICIHSVTMIYRDGTEQDAVLYFAEGYGRTKLGSSGQYDRMDIEMSADFRKPVSTDNLTAIRVNGTEIPMN